MTFAILINILFGVLIGYNEAGGFQKKDPVQNEQVQQKEEVNQ